MTPADPDSVRERLLPNPNLDVLVDGCQQVHQAFDGEARQPIVTKRGDPALVFRQLRKRGVNAKDAILTARSNRGPWRLSITAAICWALPGVYFDSLSLPYLEPQ